MSTAASPDSLCQCGRPLRHTGRHFGFVPKARLVADAPKTLTTPAAARKSKLQTVVDQEIKTCHVAIVRLKGEIRDRQTALIDIETKLSPLIKLRDVYSDLLLPAPERKVSAPVVVQPVKPAFVFAGRPIAREAGPDDQEADYEPIAVDFDLVSKWAAVRSLVFKTWDDLRAINKHREDFELPPFARKMSDR